MSGDGAERDQLIRARALVDLEAISANCALLVAATPPETELCAVVKADGYGHGCLAVAKAAILGGATRLALATAAEAALVRARLRDVPLLTMGALTRSDLALALRADSDVAVWHPDFADAAIEAGRLIGVRPRLHVKYDTGMGRLGARDPELVIALAERIAADERLELAGLWTHFATADEDGDEYLQQQVDRFAEIAGPLRERHPGMLVHAANSAATLREPRSHFDMVRCGIAVYGLDPYGRDPSRHGLRPALSLRSYVADVKRLGAGESAGYGRTWIAGAETRIAVVPIGYGDGVRRALGNRGEVLIRGRRHPVRGTVSMDNLTAELGIDTQVQPGDEVVLIGSQGDETILCEEVAATLETINYEVTCGISGRVPRQHLRAGP